MSSPNPTDSLQNQTTIPPQPWQVNSIIIVAAGRCWPLSLAWSSVCLDWGELRWAVTNVVAVSTIWKWSPDQIDKIRVGHGLAKRHVAGHDAGSSVGFITEVGVKPLPSGLGI